MPMDTASRALKAALEAARKAGVVALKGFRGGSASPRGGRDPRSGIKVEYKSDSSPVTAWDRASEEIIRRTLARQFPGDGFIGEEYGEIGGNTGASWVIDPIDGTKNFIRGIPFWGSLIARVVGGKLALGVMHLPALGETLWATRGGGAFRNGKPLRVSRVRDLRHSTILYGGLKYFMKRGQKADMAELRPLALIAARSASTRCFGDCWAYTFVARGLAEAMLEKDVKPWDIAATSVIIREAGGRCTDWKGREDWRADSILATNGLVHAPLLKLLRR